jgi:drug/metabolite transporter (DMT)-like permease
MADSNIGTGFFSILGIICLFIGLSHIGATKAALTSTIESATTVTLSMVFLGEALTIAQLVGCILYSKQCIFITNISK